MQATIPIAATWPTPPARILSDGWWARVGRLSRRGMQGPDEGAAGSGGEAAPSPGGVDADLELLERVRAGYPHETQAFTEIVQRHWTRVWTVCQAVLLDANDAEEAAQDTFLKVHRFLPSFRGESRFTTWLGRIAHRAAIDRLRTRRRERSLRDGLERDPDSAPGAAPRAPHPEDAQVARMRGALSRLAPEDRSLLILRDVEGHSYEEIAGMLGIEPGAARMRLTRARARLREAFRLTPGVDRRWPWQP